MRILLIVHRLDIHYKYIYIANEARYLKIILKTIKIIFNAVAIIHVL